MAEDYGLESLLALDGEIIQQAYGYWVKFEIREVDTTSARPKGIKYSLSLHREDGERILGFDNAHGFDNGRNHRWLTKYDHEHRLGKEKIYPYDYKNAETLMVNFWTAVDEAIEHLEG